MDGTDGEPSDAELVASAVLDPQAFGLFYDRHVAAILRYLHRRTDSVETAADLCAETFAAASRSGPPATPGPLPGRGCTRSPATSWATTCAAGRCPTATGAASASSRSSLTPQELERVEELVDAARSGPASVIALAQLPASLADAVVLRIGEDLAYPDVAARLGCSEGAARAPVSRGLNRLADLMEEP